VWRGGVELPADESPWRGRRDVFLRKGGKHPGRSQPVHPAEMEHALHVVGEGFLEILQGERRAASPAAPVHSASTAKQLQLGLASGALHGTTSLRHFSRYLLAFAAMKKNLLIVHEIEVDKREFVVIL